MNVHQWQDQASEQITAASSVSTVRQPTQLRHPVATDPSLSSLRTGLILAPPLLLATTLLAFNSFVGLFGFHLGYLFGFLFKWLFWCLLVPLWIVGPQGLRRMLRATDPPVGRPQWLGWLLLTLPLVVAYGYAFPRVLPYATVGIVLLSAVIALVNGTLEEVFWRGTYVQVFPRQAFWGFVYPSIGFGLWHIAPQSVSQGMSNPGGTAAFVVVGMLFGLGWGWVAWRTGSIRWTVISHVLLDFAGLGALVYFR